MTPEINISIQVASCHNEFVMHNPNHVNALWIECQNIPCDKCPALKMGFLFLHTTNILYGSQSAWVRSNYIIMSHKILPLNIEYNFIFKIGTQAHFLSFITRIEN